MDIKKLAGIVIGNKQAIQNAEKLANEANNTAQKMQLYKHDFSIKDDSDQTLLIRVISFRAIPYTSIYEITIDTVINVLIRSNFNDYYNAAVYFGGTKVYAYNNLALQTYSISADEITNDVVTPY